MTVEGPWREDDDEEAGEVEVGERVGLQPGGPTPKRLRDKSWGLGGGGKQQQGKRRRLQKEVDRQEQRRGKWCLPGFSVDPGCAVLVADSYVVKSVQTQVVRCSMEGGMAWGSALQRRRSYHRLDAEW